MSIARIREALAAGPTLGPWSVETVPTSCGICHKVGPFPGKRPDDPPRHACLYADYPSQGNPADDELKANADFIAACYPEAIRELLAGNDALQAENASLRGMLAHLYAGSDLYSDDGELQDARAVPLIDFKRDSVADIRCAMVERNERKEQR